VQNVRRLLQKSISIACKKALLLPVKKSIANEYLPPSIVAAVAPMAPGDNRKAGTTLWV
jgi:hypothetical protein